MKRPFDTDFKIGAEPILAPDEGVEVEFEDLLSDDSERDESGVFHPTFIRTEMRVFSFEYSALTVDEYKYLKRIIPSGQILQLTYTHEGKPELVKVYAKKSGFGFFSKRLGLYRNFQFQLIEI